MAYLRFSNSNWYMYWTGPNYPTTHKHQEILSVWHVTDSPNGPDVIELDYLKWKKFKESPDWTLWKNSVITQNEKIEMLNCLDKWIGEVDKHWAKIKSLKLKKKNK